MRDWKEGNVLFNDALNTFYLWLYGVRHMVKDHSDLKSVQFSFQLKLLEYLRQKTKTLFE